MLTDVQRRVRLILQGRLSNEKIAELTNCSRNTVTNWRKRLDELDPDSQDFDALDDQELRKLITPGAFRRENRFEKPNFDQVLFELNERGVTAKTMFNEYVDRVPEAAESMSLATFYREIQRHADQQGVTITFEYEAGEMIQADFVGRKKAKQPFLIDATGAELGYEVFCAVSAKSRKTFVLAIQSQAKQPVLDVFVKMLEFFGGVPVLVVIDNFAAAVARPRRGDNEAVLTPEFQELADYYGFGLLATKVRKPKHKALAENAVGISQNDVLAPLRNRRFFSLQEMNVEIQRLVEELNSRALPILTNESRNDLFLRTDKPGYQTLPKIPLQPGRWLLRIRVGRDYHVAVEGSRYSVPFRHSGVLINVKITGAAVHLHFDGKVIATHKRSDNSEHAITSPSHMPPSHRSAVLTRLTGIKSFVRDIGPAAEQLIEEHFRSNRKPAATAQVAIRLRTLAEEYPLERVEFACQRAVTIKKCSAICVEQILLGGLDSLKIHREISDQPPPEPIRNVRGSAYYSECLANQSEGDDDV